MSGENRAETIIRWVAFGLAVLAVVVGGLIYGSLILTSWAAYPDWPKLFETHFAAIIGLPAAAGTAFVLVMLLRTVEGPIEFEITPLKFKGASGPIIMWAICFLSITGGIKLLY